MILGAVCLCSRRTRQRLLTPVTRRFTNNTLINSGDRGVDSTGRRSGRGGDMHKSLMSEAESMAYTTTASPRDVRAPPQMAMVESSNGLSQNPVFMGAAAAYPSRPNSWRTWRPSATFAQGLDPVPDEMQPPPPPPHALTGNRYPAFPPQTRGSGVSTGEDSSMPEYGAWPPAASNADLKALTPAPGQAVSGLAPGYVAASGPERVQSRDHFRQQAEEAEAAGSGEGDGHASYVTYSETPLATPRTPIVVEGEQLAPLATSQEASPVDNCDCDSGEGGDAGRGTRSDDIIWDGEQQQHHHRGLGSSGSNITITSGDGRVSRGRGIDGSGSDGDDDEQPEGGGIQEAQLGREAGEGGGHGGGAQGVEAEPPGEQGGQQAERGQQGEPGERGQQVLEEVAAVGGQRFLRGSRRASSSSSSSSRRSASSPLAPRAPSYWDEDSGDSAGGRFSWSEAASEPYTAVAATTDGFGLSIIGAGRGSRSAGAGDSARPGGDG